jgi:formylglycine-generating enzyme required for sulfatase activity
MCDMAGNVGEWTNSFLYGYVVYRGGVWDDHANGCSVGLRPISTQSYMSNDIGFRVCR